MTVLPRAATSTELGYIRRDNQSTRLYLTVHQPATVYTARLAAVPSSTDQVTSITYNTGSGTHTDILADQTLLVGSTAGAFDYGQCRIRNTSGIGATTGTFNLGETSEVNWQANAYLTVLDEFVPWAKHLRTVGTTVYMDYDVAYSDQNSKCDSIPILGPHRVAWLRGDEVTLSFDASQSWALNNTITGYSWTFTGAVSTTGTTTATPTATYDTLGTYRIACTVTNSDLKSFTAYRYVFIVDETTVLDQFSLGSVRGDYSTGGWSFDVTAYAEASRTTIRDRALVILHALDYYGDTQTSVGYVAGSENVVAIGYIAGDTIQRASQDQSGSVAFSVQGLHYWLDQMTAFPIGLKDTASAPVKWTRFQGLTPKVVTWHWLHWRTTLTRFADVYAMTNQHRAARIEAPGSQSLWQQINTMLDSTVIGNVCADRYGRVFPQIEQQVLSSTEKSGIATIMAISDADWAGQIDIERQPTPRCSLADFSGVSYDGTNATPYYSLSPGHVFKQFGKPDVRDRLLIDSQTVANQRCGAFVGWQNNPYPRISFTVPANNRLIDVAPYQWLTLDIASSDTVREITASALKLIPRSVEYIFQDGYITARLECEAESTAEISVTNIRPPIVITPIETPPPPPPPPPPVPTPTASGTEVWLWHYSATSTPTTAIIYSTDFFSALGSPTWHTVAALPANLGEMYYGSIRADGTQCYVIGVDTNNSKTAIWRCANPKAVAPTWSQDLVNGTSYFSNGGTTYYHDQAFYYSETPEGYQSLVQGYSSPVSSFGPIMLANTSEITPASVRGRTVAGAMPGGLWLQANHIIGTRVKGETRKTALIGRSIAGGDYITGAPDSNHYTQVTSLKLPMFSGQQFAYGNYGDASLILSLTSSAPSTSSVVDWRKALTVSGFKPVSIYGSMYGTSVYVLMFNNISGLNRLYYSLNGIDFNISSTQEWSFGKVLSANLSGGKFAVWVVGKAYYSSPALAVTNSNEFIRYCADISNTTANPWTSATGDLWTSVISAGSLNVLNAGIVYA